MLRLRSRGLALEAARRAPSSRPGACLAAHAACACHPDSEIGSPLAIRSPMGGTRHPSVPQVSPPDGHSPLATTHDRCASCRCVCGNAGHVPIQRRSASSHCRARVSCRSLARPTTIPQSPGTPLQIRSRKKTVVIDDPKVLPSAPSCWCSFVCACCRCFAALSAHTRAYAGRKFPFLTLELSAGATGSCVVHTLLRCVPLPHSALPLDVRVRPTLHPVANAMPV